MLLLAAELGGYTEEVICTRSSMDRAFDYGSKGCRFESCRVHHLFVYCNRYLRLSVQKRFIVVLNLGLTSGMLLRTLCNPHAMNLG